ncbi:MAG TPA: hypothetical protein VIY29_20345 [Ktedonobacteraceae bacterium]
MEVIRGVLTIIFGLLFIFIDVRFFIYILGIYLIIDGSLDMYKIATGKRDSKRKVLSSLGSASSIVLGLISLVYHVLAIFLLLIIIAVRIIISIVRAIIEARRSRSPYAGVIWLYGGLLVLSGLVLFFFPVHRFFFTRIFLRNFIIVYALCDGFYLLVRGLLLRFAPAVYTRLTFQAPDSLLWISDDLPPTTRRAIVFVRRKGATGLGHIAWAFEWFNGWFNAGSVENATNKPYATPEEMGFWAMHTLDPIATMQKRSSTYDEYKLFFVSQPRPKEAWRTVVWESRQPYFAMRHNCNDVAYDVLRAYGTTGLLDPAQEHVPNDWYDALPGRSYTIAEHPVIPVRMLKMSQRELAIREILLTIPSHIKGAPPPWRMRGWRAWEELSLAWDKMLKDVWKLFISMRKRVTKRQL